jgi:hypothetical protein
LYTGISDCINPPKRRAVIIDYASARVRSSATAEYSPIFADKAELQSGNVLIEMERLEKEGPLSLHFLDPSI